MKIRPVLFALVLAGCNLLPASTQTNITNFLTSLANKATADLTVALNVANAANPVDTAGANCAGALIQVQGDVNKVVVAATNAGAGAITAAEVASLFQPGSPQANNERDVIVQGCAVKVAQVSGAIAGTAAWFTALATMFAVAVPGA